jgi:hypothetical protein
MNKLKCLDDPEKEFIKLHEVYSNDKPLYHYTSFKSLEKIFKDQLLWSMSYEFLNDPTEFKFAIKKISSLLKEYNTRLSKFGVDSIPLVQITEHLLSEISKNHKLYITSFSKEVDKLSLWRYYTNNATGVAIEFNPVCFSSTPEEDISSPCFFEVAYGDNAMKEKMEPFIEVFEKYITQPKVRDTLTFKKYKSLYNILIANLLVLAPRFKDKSFEDEHEVRLVYDEGIKTKSDGSGEVFYFDNRDRGFIEQDDRDLEFVDHQLYIKPYLKKFHFSKDHINAIHIGPACNFDRAKIFVQTILLELGYTNSIEIKACLLPFTNRS